MADNVIPAVNAQRLALQGLPLRLIQDGLLDEKSMQVAMAAAKDANTNLVSHLVANNLANAREIAIAASQEFGVPLLDLDAIQPDLETIKLVSDKLLAKHRVLPLVKRGKRLFVAVSDPTNLHALDEIKFQTGLSIEAVVVEEDKLQRVGSKAIEQVDTQMPTLADDDIDLENLDVTGGEEDRDKDAVARDDVEDAPIVRFVNKVLLDAIKKGASDIHFEPYEKSYRIRLRLDGYLKEIANPPVQLAVKLAARLKVMSRLDIAERRVPQDGRIKMRISKNRAIDFRVSTCPTLFGEKVVARILDPSSAMLGIDALGYEQVQRELYMQALAQPHGMILVTGPTGSGKTVSLYTGLNILNKEDTNISTAEDPAEINLPGVNQVNVNPKVGLTFASALRAFLRQDPDVIMVGEIRDLETAEIAIKAAQTGHLVLSTLHTNDAPKTLTRLIDMGVEPHIVAPSVLGVIGQRLVRRICPDCKVEDKEPMNLPVGPGEKLPSVIYKGKGCENCRQSGYRGRIGIYETLVVDPGVRQLIMQKAPAEQIKQHLLSKGWKTMRQDGWMRVGTGETTPEEVLKVTMDD